MDATSCIRPFESSDAPAVRALFVAVNRLLAPPHLAAAFEAYVERSLSEEIDRIVDYYAGKRGGFWVCSSPGTLYGMFGLEPSDADSMELRRMYVDPAMRRQGIANAMLAFAEAEVRRRGKSRLVLSTSELQPAALALYRRAGYRLLREEIADAQSNKVLGGGIRRFHFEKNL